MVLTNLCTGFLGVKTPKILPIITVFKIITFLFKVFYPTLKTHLFGVVTMKKPVLTITALVAAITILSVASCTKLETEVENTTTTAEDITRTEAYLASVFNITEDVASSDGRLNKTGNTLLPPGAKVVFTDSSFTDGDGVKYYVDFGPLPGLLCLDGVTRAGRIDVAQTGRYSGNGAQLTVTVPETNNFYVSSTGGMTKVSGVATITRLSDIKINFNIKNGKAENSSDGTVTFNSDKDIVHQELGQAGITDDIFSSYGSGDGTNTKGKPYTWKTTDSVVKIEKPNCTFPIKGVIELTTENKTYKIDFEPDGGACDKKVVYTLPNGTKIPKTFQ